MTSRDQVLARWGRGIADHIPAEGLVVAATALFLVVDVEHFQHDAEESR